MTDTSRGSSGTVILENSHTTTERRVSLMWDQQVVQMIQRTVAEVLTAMEVIEDHMEPSGEMIITIRATQVMKSRTTDNQENNNG